MPVLRRDIVIYKGSVWSDSFFLVRVDNEQVEDISGWTARMDIRSAPEDEQPILRLSTENGGITLDGPAASVTPIVHSTTSSGLPGKGAWYDLEVADPTGEAQRQAEGRISLRPEITR